MTHPKEVRGLKQFGIIIVLLIVDVFVLVLSQDCASVALNYSKLCKIDILDPGLSKGVLCNHLCQSVHPSVGPLVRGPS